MFRLLSTAPALLSLLAIMLAVTPHASGTPGIAEVVVVVDGPRDSLEIVVHVVGDEPGLQASVSGALLDMLGRVPGSFSMTRNGSGLFIRASVNGLLKYIAADKELFIAYMDYSVPSNSSRSCLSVLGRTGFDLGLLIPEKLRGIMGTAGTDKVVFRIVSPYLNASALEEAAGTIAPHLPGGVAVSENALVLTLDDASGHACVPYEAWFWKLFGVPRAVAIIPPDSLDRCTVYSYILLKIRVWYVPLRNITAVYTPPTGLVPRYAGGWGTVVLCHSNKTSIRFSAPYSTERFVAGANLVAMKPGVYELGKVRLTYCLPTSGLCTGADIPVYVSRTGKTALTVREYQCFSGPDYRFWVETLPVIGAIATLAVVAILIAVNLTRRRKPL